MFQNLVCSLKCFSLRTSSCLARLRWGPSKIHTTSTSEFCNSLIIRYQPRTCRRGWGKGAKCNLCVRRVPSLWIRLVERSWSNLRSLQNYSFAFEFCESMRKDFYYVGTMTTSWNVLRMHTLLWTYHALFRNGISPFTPIRSLSPSKFNGKKCLSKGCNRLS